MIGWMIWLVLMMACMILSLDHKGAGYAGPFMIAACGFSLIFAFLGAGHDRDDG